MEDIVGVIVESRDIRKEHEVCNAQESYYNTEYWKSIGDMDTFIFCPHCNSSIVLEQGKIPSAKINNWLPMSVELNSKKFFYIIDTLQAMIALTNLLKQSLEDTTDGTKCLLYSKISSIRHYLIAHRRKVLAGAFESNTPCNEEDNNV